MYDFKPKLCQNDTLRAKKGKFGTFGRLISPKLGNWTETLGNSTETME